MVTHTSEFLDAGGIGVQHLSKPCHNEVYLFTANTECWIYDVHGFKFILAFLF